MEYWNYRIIKLENKSYNEVWYEVREVYYNKDNSIELWSSASESFNFKSMEEAIELNTHILQAMSKPVLALVINDNGEEHLEELNEILYNII